MKRLILLLILICWPLEVLAVEIGERIPDFTLKTFAGNTINSKDLRGNKALMLVFWATWCSVCEEEIPELNDVYLRFGDKKLAMVGVNVSINDPEERVRKYVKKFGISYPIYYDNKAKLTREFMVIGTPTIIIADINGIIRFRGAIIPSQIDKLYHQFLQ